MPDYIVDYSGDYLHADGVETLVFHGDNIIGCKGRRGDLDETDLQPGELMSTTTKELVFLLFAASFAITTVPEYGNKIMDEDDNAYEVLGVQSRVDGTQYRCSVRAIPS